MQRTLTWLVAGLGAAARSVRRPALPLLALFVGVTMAAVLAIANNAQAATTPMLKLQPLGTHSSVSLSTTTCAAATTKLRSESASTRYTLAVAPHHFPALTVTHVSITTDAASCTTLVLEGTSNVFGLHANVLVVGTWASTTATTPTFTVAVDFGTVGLDELLTSSSTTNVGATFSGVWLAATTATTASTLPLTSNATTSALKTVATFFTGVQGSTVTVAPSGLSFVGALARTGELATGLGKLGVSNVQLTGKLVSKLTTLSASAPPKATAGFTVTAHVTLSLATPPSWLTLTTGFTLSVSGQKSGSWSVGVNGSATLTLPPDTTPTTFTVRFAVSKAGSSTPVTVSLNVDMGTLTTAFGLSWLTLTTASLTWTVSSATLTATLHAKVTLGTAPTTIALTATASLSSSAGTTVTLSLTTSSNTLSTTRLAGDLGLTLPKSTPSATLKHLVLYLNVPKSGTGSVSVAAEAGATLTIGTASTLSVSFLVRDQVGQSVLVAAKTTTAFTLKQLVSALPTDVNVSMTALSVVFATSNVTLKSTALDAPTYTFFKPIYCSPGKTCAFTLSVKSGVTIQAAVALPATLKKMVCKLVDPTTTPTPTTCLTGPVTIDGHIPLFNTAKTVSLTIALPTVDISSGPVRGITLALSISEATATFTVTASGDLTMLVPSADVTGNDTGCPAGVTPPATDVCLTLTLSGTLTAGKTGVAITFSATLTAKDGWRLPQPVTWLTMDRLAVQIGVRASETGAGVTFGLGGSLTVGTTLRFAVHLEATANPPWLELLGFKVQSTTGISMHDLAALYHDVSGKTVTPAVLPPVALKDLLFQYSRTNDKPLQLCAGLKISADLVITNGTWAQGSYTAPGSVTCTTTGAPPSSNACSHNKSACLASVLITVSKSGFTGYGHLAGWTAGPLEVTTTTLALTLTSKVVQIHIAGGGKLLNPVTWATPATRASAKEWFGGTVTLTVGTKRLHLSASGDIGTLATTISATSSLTNLQKPDFTVTSWFTTAKKALKKMGNQIKAGLTTVGTTVKGWSATYLTTTANQVVGDIHNAFDTLDSPQPTSWKTLYNVFQEITSDISTWNTDVNSVHMSFLDITASAIFHDVLHGITIGSIQLCAFTHCTTLVNGFHVTGICSYVKTIEGSPLCTSTPVSGAQTVYANPTVTSHLSSATLTLPPGSSDKSLVTTLHTVDPTGGTTPPISCAMATENFNTGSVSPTTFQVDALGNSVTFSGPTPTVLGNPADQTSNNQQVGQGTLDTLYSGQNQGLCTLPTAQSTVPSLQMGLRQSWVYEGGTVTAVALAGTGVTGVTLTWGDGTAPTTATYTTTKGAYLASHRYADETGSPFTVTATATVSSGTAPTPVTRNVSVVDAPLQLGTLTVTPASITVMQRVTVSGTLSNPEATEPATATITWGDGTRTTTVAITSTSGSFSASHVYTRLTPTGAPSRTEPISVTVSEADGTTAKQSSSVTVNDVTPTGLTLSPTSGAGVTGNGTVFTHVGTATGWTSKVFDVSPTQRFTFTYTWADGTAANYVTVTAPTPASPNSSKLYTYPVPTGAITHTFANVCLNTVSATATDDDTLSTALTRSVIVTAPLGFTPVGSGYWHEQVNGSIPTNTGGTFSATQITCYLRIAQHLSSQLTLALTPTETSASQILDPKLGGLTHTQKLEAQLKEELLTVLLDFANGSWNWTQAVGAKGATLQTLVSNANQALASPTPHALRTALGALRRLVGGQ